jgi:tetratricopeptide (TPR) repeat protein
MRIRLWTGAEKLSTETPDTLKAEFEPYLKELEENRKNGSAEIKKNASAYLSKAEKFKSDADTLFPGDYLRVFRQSLLYFSCAASLEAVADCLEGDDEQRISLYSQAGKMFHFSGHSYRNLEEYRRSGIAYNESGRCYVTAARLQERLNKPQEQIRKIVSDAVRSYRRAKGVWSDVGDYDMAGKAFFSEQKLWQKKLKSENWMRGTIFGLWGIITGYGESLRNWIITLILSVLVFALANWVSGIDPLEALSLSIQRSFLIANPIGNRALLLVQTAYSYFILGLGLAIIVRRFGPR